MDLEGCNQKIHWLKCRKSCWLSNILCNYNKKENTSTENFDNIILPLDLGKETKEKVTFAIEYARYWNSTIRIVSVYLKDNTNEKYTH